MTEKKCTTLAKNFKHEIIVNDAKLKAIEFINFNSFSENKNSKIANSQSFKVSHSKEKQKKSVDSLKNFKRNQ